MDGVEARSNQLSKQLRQDYPYLGGIHSTELVCWGVWNEDAGGKEEGTFPMKATNLACGIKRKKACPVTAISFSVQQTGTQTLQVFYILRCSPLL